MSVFQGAAGLSRRGFLIGAGGLAATAALTACGSGGASGPAASGPWEFTDDRGRQAAREQRPARVVAYVSSAAALWDYGVRPVGVFGPQKTADGKKEIQAGNIDLNAVTSIGNAWDDFSMEKFAATKPDLVVTGLTGAKPTDLWVLKDDLGPKVQPIAPIVALSEYKVTLPKVIERYEQLAVALGGDANSDVIKKGKEDFRKASDDLKAAIKAKPGLKVLVVSSDKDSLYVCKPEFFADLAYYRDLGLDIVNGGGSDDYFETLSWEQAGKYPADLILTDSRTYALSRQQMAQFPTWAQLPAVRAGQLADWSTEPRFNPVLAAPVIRKLAEVVTGARTDITA
ncbi:ABC transporter substrate-binding protein [Amycolatopsis australiensis]|uniref:Iron complex transport system substrate-binding protein n=1 Tax=Amycolatopsis australiensis TaxID=546364 RepID=A0A1K1SAU0_9PSEU|nr:ABC transporter substrate-binding protein [Amycolatopsis australiensis]SFW81481.1 iron complex transport system substrate-binding protein [Amycolatopsis australiensis]